MKDMPKDFIPCKAPNCSRWYNRLNVVRKGYCDKHKHLVVERNFFPDTLKER